MSTGHEFPWIKIDPEIALARNGPMLIATDIDKATPVPPPKARAPVARKDKDAVAPERDFSEQTHWMLAVRDKRDKAAFARLFDFYAPRLKGFAIRSGADPGMAEEIVQDVMLTLWRKAHLFDPERAQVSGWIYQITRNRQIDMMRRQSRALPEELTPEEGHDPDPGQVLALEQEAGRLKQALQRLKPEQRAMIEKAYLGDLTHQEIRAETGLPLGTIKSRIRLGLDRLRHELKGLREP